MNLLRIAKKIFHPPIYRINWVALGVENSRMPEMKPKYRDASRQVRKNAKALEAKRAEIRAGKGQEKVVKIAGKRRAK